MLKVCHSELPANYFIDRFKITSDVHVYLTRHAHDYHISSDRTNLFKNTIAILVQCWTLLNPILRCYQMLISLSVHINDMSSQKTRQCMINCSILSTKLLGYCFLNVLMGYFSYFILQVFTLYKRFPVHKSLTSWEGYLFVWFDIVLHLFILQQCCDCNESDK